MLGEYIAEKSFLIVIACRRHLLAAALTMMPLALMSIIQVDDRI